MIKRIMERKLNTNGKDWKNSWTRHSTYLDNIAKYNSDWYLSKVRSLRIVTDSGNHKVESHHY